MSPSRFRYSIYTKNKQLQQRIDVIKGLIIVMLLFAMAAIIPTLVINFILFWNYA